MRLWTSWVAGIAAAFMAAPALGQAPAPPGPPPPDFTIIINPILQSRCVSCHGASVQRGGLRLDDRDAALKGGVSGPAILPGDSGGSKLFQMVASKKMPLDDELSLLELGALKAWIDGGARWPEKRVIANMTVDPRIDDLRVALRNRDRATAGKLLADPGMLKARGKDGSTALHHLVVYGELAQVRAALDKGADVNAANLEGVTPLIWGVRDDAIAALLVERGGDVNAASYSGVSPLVAVAGRADGDATVRLLVNKGAKLSPPQKAQSASALGFAQNLDSFKALFPRVIEVNGPPAAIAAVNVVISRCAGCLDFLIAQGSRGETLNGALVAAANSGDAAMVKRLLAVGATLDGRGPQDATVLIAAALSDIQAAEKVDLLLAAGADVNAPDAHGRTPLSYARAVRPELVPALVAKGAK